MIASKASFLSRARVRHDAPTSALRELLSESAADRTAGSHRMLWTLFSDDPDRERDFLWREADPGTFYLLSAREPEDRHGLFHLDPPKQFNPSLATGDRLRFAVRVNATVSRTAVGKPGRSGRWRGGRCDVVMDAIHAVPEGERAEPRATLLPDVARTWLSEQGKRHGFALAQSEAWETSDERGGEQGSLWVKGYRALRIHRGPRTKPMKIGVLDLEGILAVQDPAAFISGIMNGFGRAKAFGCGLMLIRRAV